MYVVLWSGLVAFLLDQVSKFVMVHYVNISDVREIQVFAPFLQFRYGENRGINFGMLSDAPDAMRWVLIVFSLLIIVAVFYWVRRLAHHGMFAVSAGLLMGGAFGNVLDRLLYGYVIDFLNMSCCGINNPYVFNLADIFIVGGALGLICLESRARTARSS